MVQVLLYLTASTEKDATGVATDVASGVADGNSVMAGAMVPDKTEAMAYLCTRVSNDKSNKAKFDATPIVLTSRIMTVKLLIL